YKQKQVEFQKEHSVQHHMFSDGTYVNTDATKSNRVWKGLSKKLSSHGVRDIYYAFLSEMDSIETLLFDYILKIFSTDKHIETDFSDPTILKISKIVKQVGREKHRMEAFVRFKLTKDDWY